MFIYKKHNIIIAHNTQRYASMTPKGGNKFDDTNNQCEIYCDAVYKGFIGVLLQLVQTKSGNAAWSSHPFQGL
jgi:hypothetical protein